LGLVVEKLSGRSLPDYIRDHITAPLGMSHTTFATNADYPDPHAQGYTRNDTDGSTVIGTDWNPSWAWAAGAVISNLEDMHTRAPALASGKLLSPEMQAQRLQTVGATPMTAPNDGYGLGLFNLGGWIGHNGSLPGYQTAVFYLPEKQTTGHLHQHRYRLPGVDTSAMLATAITTIISPDHVNKLAAH
jgi:D-alanyl-D-alanine carboxypeptidase